MTIAERIAATENRLDAARSKRADAVLAGRKYDLGEVAAVEAELAALSDAAAEEVRRERAATSHARRTRRGEQIERLKELDRKRTEALQAAEDGARQLADGLAKTFELTALMASEMREITGTVPMPLQTVAAAGRISNRVSAVMRTVKPGPAGGRFGNINWPSTMNQASESWPAEESKILAPYLNNL